MKIMLYIKAMHLKRFVYGLRSYDVSQKIIWCKSSTGKIIA